MLRLDFEFVKYMCIKYFLRVELDFSGYVYRFFFLLYIKRDVKSNLIWLMYIYFFIILIIIRVVWEEFFRLKEKFSLF